MKLKHAIGNIFVVAYLLCTMPVFAALNATESLEVETYLHDYLKDVVVVKTVKSQMGESVSCVDIYHQPGTKSLKGQSIQLEPSMELKAMLGGKVKGDTFPSNCPKGSVEMILPTRGQIERAGSLDRFLGKHLKNGNWSSSPSIYSSGHEYAVVMQSFPSGNVQGVQTTLNVWAPTVPMTSPVTDRFSLSQLWATSGSGSGLQTVEAGWVVFPANPNNFPTEPTFNDTLPHFFIFATPDGYNPSNPKNCWNNLCGNFIKSNNAIVIGGVLPYSTSGGTQVEVTLAAARDPATSNWWIFYVDNTGTYNPVGYYPAAFFAGGAMSYSTQSIQFGGEVAASVGTSPHPSIQMGSGVLPMASGYGQVAYQRNLKYLNPLLSFQDVVPAQYITDNTACYNIIGGSPSQMALYGAQSSWGTSIFFGGSGVLTGFPFGCF